MHEDYDVHESFRPKATGGNLNLVSNKNDAQATPQSGIDNVSEYDTNDAD